MAWSSRPAAAASTLLPLAAAAAWLLGSMALLSGRAGRPAVLPDPAAGSGGGCGAGWNASFLVTVGDGGRLGNQMAQYASLALAAEAAGLVPYVSPRMRSYLSSPFPNTGIPTLEELTGCQEERGGAAAAIARGNTSKINFIYVPDIKDLPAKVAQQRKTADANGRTVFKIAGFPKDVAGFVRSKHAVQRMFKFSRGYSDAAAGHLGELQARQRARARSKAPRGRPLVPVGVHVRRGDFRGFLKKTNGRLVTEGYFSAAMDLYRDACAAAGKACLFVVASDDLDWCKANLAGADVHFVDAPYPSRHHQRGRDGDRVDLSNRPALDMAVLAACQHSIVDYGTFSFWSGFLAGGYVLAACGNAGVFPAEHVARGDLDRWFCLAEPNGTAVIQDNKVDGDEDVGGIRRVKWVRKGDLVL